MNHCDGNAIFADYLVKNQTHDDILSKSNILTGEMRSYVGIVQTTCVPFLAYWSRSKNIVCSILAVTYVDIFLLEH